ncbi:MAG: hypothetical protein LBQ12_11400 [Deltaproteobacteria bacterium]|jgi:hypothetical protein|nr:hypothetical protein [Deltaproteobacteria bacterium]
MVQQDPAPALELVPELKDGHGEVDLLLKEKQPERERSETRALAAIASLDSLAVLAVLAVKESPAGPRDAAGIDDYDMDPDESALLVRVYLRHRNGIPGKPEDIDVARG